ncbi:MAG TPA: SRPBCC family protein [Steroidobacteraceae bacterium]|nr:SRPBCC family protein [Steroidobacteraceae bacterium]
MGTAKRWTAAASILALALSAAAWGADFELTAAESQRVAARQVVVRASLDSGQRRGTVRAAVAIDAAPAVVFLMMTRCADALQYVPHLRVCRLRDQAPDGTWMLIEHEVDFGWYTPRIRYVFRADLIADRSIKFRQISGDFKAYEGIWELTPVESGQHTLLRYRAYIDPPGFIPNWLARSTFKRELPQMLTDLRKHCEAEQVRRAQADASPH